MIQPDTLQNRVIDAIDADLDWLGCGSKARASLMEVVKWLREQKTSCEEESYWVNKVAQMIEDEV